MGKILFRIIYPLVLIQALWSAGCSYRESDLTGIPFHPDTLKVVDPADFTPMLIPDANSMTAQGVALGKKLFFDPVLSPDGSIACSTCHQPARSFTDGRPQSIGFAGRQGRRNALALHNVGYYSTGLFWDGRVATLEEQSLHPVTDSVEMAGTWEAAELRLQSHPEYPRLFREAFGIRQKTEITRVEVGKALAQFQRTLISADSRYDQMLRGALRFTDSEWRGRQIFFDADPGLPTGECGHCHQPPLFSGLEYFNNGIDEIPDLAALKDKGRAEMTGRLYDTGKFRAPTLRNISLTAPYMHDGRFETLQQVIDHYASGGHYAENVSPNVRPLHFSARDKADLLAFLLTLTDNTAAGE